MESKKPFKSYRRLSSILICITVIAVFGAIGYNLVTGSNEVSVSKLNDSGSKSNAGTTALNLTCHPKPRHYELAYISQGRTPAMGMAGLQDSSLSVNLKGRLSAQCREELAANQIDPAQHWSFVLKDSSATVQASGSLEKYNGISIFDTAARFTLTLNAYGSFMESTISDSVSQLEKQVLMDFISGFAINADGKKYEDKEGFYAASLVQSKERGIIKYHRQKTYEQNEQKIKEQYTNDSWSLDKEGLLLERRLEQRISRQVPMTTTNSQANAVSNSITLVIKHNPKAAPTHQAATRPQQTSKQVAVSYAQQNDRLERSMHQNTLGNLNWEQLKAMIFDDYQDHNRTQLFKYLRSFHFLNHKSNPLLLAETALQALGDPQIFTLIVQSLTSLPASISGQSLEKIANAPIPLKQNLYLTGALGLMQETSPELITLIIERMQSTEPEIKETAHLALGNIYNAAIANPNSEKDLIEDILRSRLGDSENIDDLRLAFLALGNTNSDDNCQLIISWLENEGRQYDSKSYQYLLESAVSAIKKCQSKNVNDFLLKQFNSQGAPIKQAIAEGLEFRILDRLWIELIVSQFEEIESERTRLTLVKLLITEAATNDKIRTRLEHLRLNDSSEAVRMLLERKMGRS